MKVIRAVLLTVTLSVLCSTGVFAEEPAATEIQTEAVTQNDASVTDEVQEAQEEAAPQKQYKAYQCTDSEIRWIAAIAVNENGYSENAVRYEVSLICNLTDAGRHGNTPYEVANSNWFAKSTKNRAKKTVISDEIFNITADVLNGNRVTDCNEHDNVNDIVSITTGGITLTSRAEIRNTNNYVGGATVIKNRYGAVYLFECFPAVGTDPFGILLG